ncbi:MULTISPECIES: O-antigen ligase family protein [unclassified Methylobacterium]|uniref:O-antigen ligase family protein n=1 Tax=unclassified Methylobacterium TaxID=2615210 RepID=UPI001FF02781|nr:MULTISPECIES: O-antigen ligase family protein [unclassified Methylobacterium]
MRIAQGRPGLVEVASAMPAAGAGSLTRLDRLVILGIGFVLQLNPMTSTFGLPFMRLSDMLPFLTIPYFLIRPGILSAMLARALPIGLVVALFAASLALKSEVQPGDLYFTLVLLLYFVQAVQLVILFRAPAGADCFAVGTLAGFAGSLLVLLAASAGVDLTGVGLAVPTDGVEPELVLFMKDKLGGLWTAGNETGHVFAVAGAAAAYLWYRTGRSAIYVAYFAALLVSFPLTNNRAGMILPAIFLVLILRRSVSVYAVLSGAAAVCALIMLFGATGYAPVPETLQSAIEKRFVDDSHADSNILERLDSTAAGLQLAAAHPFGLGNVSKENQLLMMAGVGTPHNAVVTLALQSGVLVVLAFLAGTVRIVLAPRRFGPLPFYTVLFMVPSLMFEELSINQVFLFGFALVLAASAMTRSGDPAGAQA